MSENGLQALDLNLSTPEGHIAIRKARKQFPHYCDFGDKERKNWLYNQLRAATLLIHSVANKDMLIADTTFTDELLMKSEYKDLTLVEIEAAIRNGCAGAYGDFFQITGKSCMQFIEGYVEEHRDIYRKATQKEETPETKQILENLTKWYAEQREKAKSLRYDTEIFTRAAEKDEDFRQRVLEEANKILNQK